MGQERVPWRVAIDADAVQTGAGIFNLKVQAEWALVAIESRLPAQCFYKMSHRLLEAVALAPVTIGAGIVMALCG